MERAGKKCTPPPRTHTNTHTPLLPNTPRTGREIERKREKCLRSSSTSFSWRSGGQVTFMETLFLDCSLAGVHYSSAPPLKYSLFFAKCQRMQMRTQPLTRVSCFVKSCCNLLFFFSLPFSDLPVFRLFSFLSFFLCLRFARRPASLPKPGTLKGNVSLR